MRSTLLSTLTVALLLPWWHSDAAQAISELDAQRAAFREAYPEAELGIWQLPADREALLRRYVLWPDLRAAWLQARMPAADAEIQQFLDSFGRLKPGRDLRFRYALDLAGRERWDDFLRIYELHYRDLGVARLDCLALLAELGRLSKRERRDRVARLWMTPQSQAKECDAVFARLKSEGVLDEELFKQRFALAIEAREFGIARYLARSLPAEYKQEAQSWTYAIGRPLQFLEAHDQNRRTAMYRKQLLGALQQLAYGEPETAQKLWRKVNGHHAFTPGERADIERHVALWLARTHHADAYSALSELAADAVDTEVRRWKIRTALRKHDWGAVARHIGELESGAQQTPQWQYWRAIALQKTGDLSSLTLLEALAGERSYYGFLAADELRREYAFGHREFVADEAVLVAIENMPEVQRARELFYVGLDARGRSEWDSVTATLTQHQQIQAAILAHRWGWHSRAIATAARVEHFDDLALRYPLAYATEFGNFARKSRVEPSWALGIARSESLFMPDIRSSAGAIGIMQLLPSTARRVARQLDLPFNSRTTLTDPASNIRLGTWYLGAMQQRFADNAVLATAAYNAGPQRVEAWLPEDDALDARIWIETIPYAETRSYVRRVLTANAIFRWRMAGVTARLADHLQPILPRHRVAARVASQDPASSSND